MIVGVGQPSYLRKMQDPLELLNIDKEFSRTFQIIHPIGRCMLLYCLITKKNCSKTHIRTFHTKLNISTKATG